MKETTLSKSVSLGIATSNNGFDIEAVKTQFKADTQAVIDALFAQDMEALNGLVERLGESRVQGIADGLISELESGRD